MNQNEKIRNLRDKLLIAKSKNGYVFSEQERTLIDEILLELNRVIIEDVKDAKSPTNWAKSISTLDVVNIVIKLSELFGVTDQIF